MRLTVTRRRNAVSEGAALGLLMCGRDELPSNKIAIDLSFSGAWRAWPHHDRFPQVGTDLGKGLDGMRAMTRADERKQVWNLYWDTSGTSIVIRARAQWGSGGIDPGVVAESIGGDVSAFGWRALAEEFLARLER